MSPRGTGGWLRSRELGTSAGNPLAGRPPAPRFWSFSSSWGLVPNRGSEGRGGGLPDSSPHQPLPESWQTEIILFFDVKNWRYFLNLKNVKESGIFKKNNITLKKNVRHAKSA